MLRLLELKSGLGFSTGVNAFALQHWVICNRRIQRLEFSVSIVIEKGSFVVDFSRLDSGTFLANFWVSSKGGCKLLSRFSAV